jgi:hypothetical protein
MCARAYSNTKTVGWLGRDSRGTRAGDHRRPWNLALRIQRHRRAPENLSDLALTPSAWTRSWATKPFADMQRGGRFVPLASGFPKDQDALRIEADARVLGATVEAEQRIAYPLPSTRFGYFVPARGKVMVNDQQVGERDGIAIAGEPGIAIEYRLVIHPVALGQGQPLFSGLRSPVDLRLISATPFGSGVVGAVYKAA